MSNYFCLLCNETHPDLKEHLKCKECGRVFCQDCLDVAKAAGKTSCPYCDQPMTKITNGGSSESNFIEFSPKTETKENSDSIVAILTILKFNPNITIDRLCILLNRNEGEINPVLKLLASQGIISYEGKNIMLKGPYHMKENNTEIFTPISSELSSEVEEALKYIFPEERLPEEEALKDLFPEVKLPKKKTPEKYLGEDFVIYFLWMTIPMLFTIMLPSLVFGYLITKTWTYQTNFGNEYQQYISIKSNEQGKKYIIVPLIIFSLIGTIPLYGSIFYCFGILGVNFNSILIFFLCWLIILMSPILYRNMR